VIATVSTVATELLSSDVLRGKRVFYNAADTRMALEGYMACATCHLDGGSDGRVWDFADQGEGFRRTISLRGRGGMAHGLVHWSGNFDEIQDFEIPIRGVFGGTGFIPNAQFTANPMGAANAGRSTDLDALAAYVASLSEVAPSPMRNADGTVTAAALRGRDVFRRQNCADCHSGPGFTDSQRAGLHDVGTLGVRSGSRLGGALNGLDTPTLLGLWEAAAYLHDGSAARLEDVLAHPGAAAHGGMAQLSAADRADLVAYLLQIDASEPPPVARPQSPTNVQVQ
jgi:cytochrome c peroxidase